MEQCVNCVEKYDIVVSLKNGTKLAKDVEIPTTTLTTVSKNKGKTNFHFFFRVYATTRYSKHHAAILTKEHF